MGEARFTPGPWVAHNMVNEQGAPMTPDEIGEYVKNSVIRSIEDGGSAERFLFVSSAGDRPPDICHVGNGPNGPNNAHLIAAAPDLYHALADLVENECSEHCDWEGARAALSRARGETTT